jgi:hypothetical protein
MNLPTESELIQSLFISLHSIFQCISDEDIVRVVNHTSIMLLLDIFTTSNSNTQLIPHSTVSVSTLVDNNNIMVNSLYDTIESKLQSNVIVRIWKTVLIVTARISDVYCYQQKVKSENCPFSILFAKVQYYITLLLLHAMLH